MKVGTFNVAHGDKVYFWGRGHKYLCGTVNGLLMFPTHLVLDMGGRHGTPQVVYPEQIIRVKARKAVA